MEYMAELEDKSFDSVKFIEHIAGKAIENSTNPNKSEFDVDSLEKAFSKCKADMKVLHISQMKKCQQLKENFATTQEKFKQDISQFQQRFADCQSKLCELDINVNNVAMKVMHLGSQLESVNIPRLRAVEAYTLMTYFSEFLGPGSPNIDMRDDINRINEVADIIRKLFLIAQELPNNKFEDAKKKISLKYDEIERILIEEFVKAQCANSFSEMRNIAKVLSHFKGYSQCIDAFIEQSQANVLVNKNIFHDIIPLCDKNFKIISEVFQSPKQVNGKFVLNIYQLKLHNYISTVLSDTKDSEKYLQNLTDLYRKLTTLSNVVEKYDLGDDDTYLEILTKNIFQKYLDSYISIELKNLKDKYTDLLQKYYVSLGHQKKQIYASGFHGFRRELQAAIGTRTNINIAQIEDYGGEIFLSDEITNTILNSSKEAFERCNLFSNYAKTTPHNAAHIFEVLLTYLVTEYINYAVDLGINSIPLPEVKVQLPEIYFFNITYKTSIIIDLLEKQFTDNVVPLIGTDSYLHDCITKKDSVLSDIEEKLDTGLDSTLNTIISWIKMTLQTEQKKTDFKPEFDIDIAASPACKAVVQFLQKIIQQIQASFDEKNLQNTLIELGVKFHRVIYEHLLQYVYNESGALCVICDVNEYKKCIKDLNFPLTNTLFDILHALCNLLLVKPQNLESVCCEDVLAVLDNSVLLSFIQLRSDFKSLKLSPSLKGFT